MSTKRTLMAALLLLTSGLVTTQALAQQAPDNAIEDRTRQQIRLPSEDEREEALLTGDTDIVLTRRTRLFTLHGDVEAAITDNAFLAETDKTGDVFAQTQFGIGVGTRIGGQVDVFADASVIEVLYAKETGLDYAAFTGLLGARMPIGPVQLSATWQPMVVFERDFSQRQLTSHRLRLAASLPVRVGAAMLEPSVHIERAITDPDDYSAWSGGGGLALSVPLSPRLPLLAYASIGYEYRDFDSYFPGLVGVDRRDDALSAGAGLVWRPRTWGEMRLAYSFQRNWSTSDVNRYQAHSGRLGLSARLRF